jgi:hypothetical protein
MNRLRLVGYLIAAAAGLAHCAAKLPREVKINQPKGVAIPINLSEVNLRQLADDSPVNLAAYMETKGLNWLVLTFGSKSCGACLDKSRYFEANLVKDQYLRLGPKALGQVEVIGVYTDVSVDRQELLAISEDEGLSHVAWFDPGPVKEKAMMKFFQPAGESYGVPLTVMLSRQGLLWRISSKEKIPADEILRKIATTIDETAVPEPPPVDPPETVGTIAIPLLAKEVSNRFDEIPVMACNSNEVVSLGAQFPSVTDGLRAVLVYNGVCVDQAGCLDAQAALKTWQAECESRYQMNCQFRELAVDSNDSCQDGSRLLGGQEFYDVFADHFSWGYKPVSAGSGRVKLPDVQGPLTMVFDSLGRLVFSREGAVGDSLATGMENNRLTTRAPGPQFGILLNDKPGQEGAQDQSLTFDQVRGQAKYTLMLFWNTFCSSCLEKLEKWHAEKDSPYRFCAANPSFCKVIALETDRLDSGVEASEYLAGLIAGSEGWSAKKYSMPLSVELDPPANGLAASGWYQGWVRAKFGSSEPRTVLYDREGKVLGSWRSLPDDHGARDALKKLFDEEQSIGK